MAYDAKTERLISLKKLAGKAQTSNDKGLSNEGLPSGITTTSENIFGESVTTSPSNTALYTITGQVEYLRFPATFIAGSDTSDGRHGFELKLPSDYESNSSNSKAGTYPFQNDQVINITSGSLQLIPPSFASSYEAKPYYGGNSSKGSGTLIPLLDARDWYLDYFNGVFFQQDPSGTGDQADNPDFIEGYLYIGDMLDTVVASAGGAGDGDPAAQYLVLAATASLSNERVFTAGTGIKTTDSGAGAAYTIAVRDSIVATLTGSTFSGTVSAPALSGSLTNLQDGTSYLIAGSNTTIVTGSSGAITISSTGGIDGSGAANRIATWSDSDTLTSDADFTWNGSLLDVQGDVNLNGTVVVNQSGVDKNFRVETQNKSSALQVDGETDQVLLFSGSLSDASGHGSSAADPDPRTFTDTNFFVSGSIDSRNTSRRGTSVFGGDVVVSGTLSVNRGQAGVGSMFTVTSDGKVGIGSDTPSYKLSVGGNMDVGEYIYHKNDANTFIRFQPDDINIQAGGVDLIKMTESGANTQILILSGGGTSDPNPANFGDTSFFVSGSIGSIGTSTGGSSVFGGDVLASGSVVALAGLSASLQQLSDGTSYLREGPNVTITSASDGSITISSTGGSGSPGGSNTQIQFNDSNTFGGDSTFTFNKVTNTLSVPALSGSLTRLVDGTSYLRSGTGISITTGSSGYVQVSNTGVSERQRQRYFLAQSYSAGVNVPVSSTNFATVSYDIGLIDVLLNGQLLHSGTAAQVTADPVERDYYVTGASSLKFAFDIEIDDVLDVMVYKVVS